MVTGSTIDNTPHHLAEKTSVFLQAKAEPLFFVRNIIGIEPWSYQADILHDIGEFPQVVAHTGHGVGKTALGAWILLWWIFTRNESKVITTAPTWRQVADLLWSEVHKWDRRMDLAQMGWVFPYKLLDTRLEIQQEWYAVGESTDEPEKIEGYHAPSILYIVDEAKAVPDKIFDAMAGGMSTAEAKMVMLSTPPLDALGKLYKVCTKRSEVGDWRIHHVNAEDVAKLTDGQQVSHEWIKSRKKTWGESSWMYQVRVQGLLVEVSEDRLIPPGWVDDAMNRQGKTSKTRVLSVDPARYGSDQTVLCRREGQIVHPMTKINDASVPEVERVVYDEFLQFEPKHVVIDMGGGLGAALYDYLLKRRKIRDKLVAYDGATIPADPDTYMNLRAEAYWNIRTVLGDGDMALPRDEALEEQLTSLKYEHREYRRATVIKIESKEDRRRHGLSSPNEADALVMAFSVDIEGDEPGTGVWV